MAPVKYNYYNKSESQKLKKKSYYGINIFLLYYLYFNVWINVEVLNINLYIRVIY